MKERLFDLTINISIFISKKNIYTNHLAHEEGKTIQFLYTNCKNNLEKAIMDFFLEGTMQRVSFKPSSRTVPK